MMRLKIFSTFFISMLLSLTSLAESKPNSLHSLGLKDISGQPLNFNQYKGSVVVVNFWATWCPPCIKEMPSLEGLHQHFDGKGVIVLAISAGQNADTVKAFLPQLPSSLSFTLVEDPDGLTFSSLGLRGVPNTYIYDKNGEIFDRVRGIREWDSPGVLKALTELSLQ